jgi:hypothetical protein
MFKSIKRLVIVFSMVAAALTPSVAAARPDRVVRPYSDAAAAVVALRPAPAHPVSTASASSFSWSDAAFGAAAMLALVTVGMGATLVVRRRAVLS